LHLLEKVFCTLPGQIGKSGCRAVAVGTMAGGTACRLLLASGGVSRSLGQGNRTKRSTGQRQAKNDRYFLQVSSR